MIEDLLYFDEVDDLFTSSEEERINGNQVNSLKNIFAVPKLNGLVGTARAENNFLYKNTRIYWCLQWIYWIKGKKPCISEIISLRKIGNRKNALEIINHCKPGTRVRVNRKGHGILSCLPTINNLCTWSLLKLSCYT